MATKALTAVARRPGRNRESALRAPEHGQSWQKLFKPQDGDAIWHGLSIYVRSVIRENHDQKTQELFLFLVTTNRLRKYLIQDYSDEDIERDLFLFLSGS